MYVSNVSVCVGSVEMFTAAWLAFVTALLMASSVLLVTSAGSAVASAPSI